MYLKSLEINNFRKFGKEKNKIEFVQSDYKKTIKNSLGNNSFVASATTLIIGKNNAGKTTVTKALKQAIDNENIVGSSFNLNYLKELFDHYNELFLAETFDKVNLPVMSFKFEVGLDFGAESTSVQNIKKFIPIINNEIQDFIVIDVRFFVTENEKYKAQMYKVFSKADKLNQEVKFKDFIKIIDKTDFTRKFYDLKGTQVNSSVFKINDLFDLKIIKAHLDDGETSLSSVFNKIVQYRLKDEDCSNRIRLEKEISQINDFMDEHVGESHRNAVNSVVNKITDKRNMEVHLKSNLDFDSLFKKLISYEFKENNNFIPENQFGLGYLNLMKILGQIIDYVEQYEESEEHNKVNLICIEEPENFMHPQMQELFIKNIDDALAVLLGETTKKNINSQLIITTHSSHIVNSKIHSSNTFNNINYITTNAENYSNVVALTDNKISGETNLKEINELKFLKKHIKYKVSELFFSDAIVLVEGITEESLLQNHINESDELHKFGISIFNINGAFAHIYEPLIDLLCIPCLVITDIDIKRDNSDKGKSKPQIFKQICNLRNHKTTNSVLHRYICKSEPDKEILLAEDEPGSLRLPNEINYFIGSNFKIVFQKDPINGFIASSFEEAYILQNYDNDVLNSALKKAKPGIYKRIVGSNGEEIYENSKEKSFEWQCKLADSKSDFSNILLYEIITSETNLPLLPKYITDGLTWLLEKLNYNYSPVKGE